MFFDPEKAIPEFIWVKKWGDRWVCFDHPSLDSGRYEMMPQFPGVQMPGDMMKCAVDCLNHDVWLAKYWSPCIGHPLLSIRFTPKDPSSNLDGVYNKAIAGLSKPGHLMARFGPEIILSLEISDIEDQPWSFRDVTMRDFRLIVDYYTQFPQNPCLSLKVKNRYPEYAVPIPALKYNNLPYKDENGDNCKDYVTKLELYGLSKEVEDVFVPARFSAAGLLFRAMVIPFILGLYWYTRPAGPTHGFNLIGTRLPPKAKITELEIQASSPEELMEQASSDSSEIRIRADMFNGACVIFHHRGQRIDPLHVEAVSEFVSTAGPTATASEFNKDMFQKFWKQFKKRKQDESGIDMTNIVSPHGLDGIDLEQDAYSFGNEAVLKVLFGPAWWQSCRRETRPRDRDIILQWIQSASRAEGQEILTQSLAHTCAL